MLASPSSENKIIDGKKIAGTIRQQMHAAVQKLPNIQPGLAVILLGNDPASQIYVRSKTRAAEECGLHAPHYHLPESLSQAELLALIHQLNEAPEIHGILIQLPLPPHLNKERILEAVDPCKDVDGFHPLNVGRLALGQGEKLMVPCTPAGCCVLLRHALERLGRSFKGQEAVIVGRSTIVGKPMAQLLLDRNCTTTITHSYTQNLPAVVRRADLVIAAAGKAEMIRGDWLKEDSIVIDVGINRLPTGRLVGDVCYSEALGPAAALTPVPGGVGPMTIAMLLRNTYLAACYQQGLKPDSEVEAVLK